MSRFTEDMSGKTFAQINVEPKKPTYPQADVEALRAWLGGYLDSMRANLEPMSDDYWQGYLGGTNRLGKSVQGWLDRNQKEA